MFVCVCVREHIMSLFNLLEKVRFQFRNQNSILKKWCVYACVCEYVCIYQYISLYNFEISNSLNKIPF